MPYFVFEIGADRKLAFVEAFDKYQPAKDLCRTRREQGELAQGASIRLVHAKNEKEAARLLSERRKPSTPLEEWEV
jgi:hypothetical protein